jgi:hypothetical protein
MSRNITHTTLKNDAKQVTGYEIKVDGATVGTAAKTEKGKFTFVGKGDFKIEGEKGTMRDLKLAVDALPGLDEFVKANQPAPKAPKEPKAAATKADPAPATPSEAKPAEGDIDLS